MGTTIRPEVSERNPYWIERHRYYELKHFCMQYPSWRKAYALLEGSPSRADITSVVKRVTGDSTAKYGIARAYYSSRMEMLERVAAWTDPVIGIYILKGVTEGVSYDVLQARFTNIPCCKDTYYLLYRKFFWLLSQERA